jgi:DNA-binding CsgD family transcriptional regulator
MSDLDEPLSEREIEILQQVATGASNKEIAAALVISPNTVKVHLRNIFTKIGVVSRTEATLYAIKHNFVEQPNLAAPLAVLDESEEAPSENPPEIETKPLTVELTEQPLPESAPLLKRRWPLIAAFASIVALIGIGLAFFFGQNNQKNQTPLLSPQQSTPLPSSSQWIHDTTLPAPRVGMGTIFYNNIFYLIGGNDGKTVTDEVLALDTTSKTWARLAEKPTPCAGIRAILISERVYVPGCKLANGQPSDILEVFNPRQNRWSTRKSLPIPLSDYAATSYEGQLYVFGGQTSEGYSDKVFIYNPQTDSWSEGSNLPSPRAMEAAEVYEGKILVVGGYDGSQVFTDVLSYTPTRDTPEDNPWDKGPPLPVGRYGMSSASLANMVYLFGGKGSSESAMPSIILQPQAKSWVEIAMPAMAMPYQGSAQTAGNFIHIFGGVLDAAPSERHLSYQAIFTISIPFTNTQ